MTKQGFKPLDIVISRWFAAAPHLVFRQWTEAEALKDWFAPHTYQGVEAKVDGLRSLHKASPSDSRGDLSRPAQRPWPAQ